MMFFKKRIILKCLVFGTTIGFGSLGIYGSLITKREIKCLNKHNNLNEKNLQDVISKSRKLLLMKKLVKNCPGINISVTVDGHNVWSEGFGWADVENEVPCTPETSMRIASISKPMTMALVAKLHQHGLLDLDKPVEDYVPDWPPKLYRGKKTNITTRKLVSMIGGIRNYDKCNENSDTKPTTSLKPKEMYINTHFKNVTKSLDIFKNDDLCSFPGTEFLYSSHCWTLISAVVEGATKMKFSELMEAMFQDIGMKQTHLDRNAIIIANRSSYYEMDESGRLRNAPSVDLSYKWAAGGIMSTPEDICLFGNTLLSCYQGCTGCILREDNLKNLVGEDRLSSSLTHPFLSQKSMKMVWKGVIKSPKQGLVDCFYAMGWCSSEKYPPNSDLNKQGLKRNKRKFFYHTGGSIGASSVLMVMSRGDAVTDEFSHPKGTVVAITTNMNKVGLANEALQIADLFEDVYASEPHE